VWVRTGGDRPQIAAGQVDPSIVPNPPHAVVTASAPLALAAATIAGIVVAVVVLGITGGLTSAATGLFDPGVVVRIGLPAARVLHDLLAALTVGLLVLAAWFVAPESAVRDGHLSGSRQWLVQTAVTTSIIWAGAAASVLMFEAASVAAVPVGAPGYGEALLSFVTQIPLGGALGVSLMLVVVVACLTILASRIETVAWAAAVSLLALLPLALGGHASGTQDHANSVDSLALHLVAVCLWSGGLAALLLVARQLGGQLSVVTGRYSTLAGCCFVVVAGSGLINAMLRLDSVSNLATEYGVLVIGKIVFLGLLGAAGWLHRRITLRRLDQNRRWFMRLAAAEVAVMGATIGLAVALSSSAPPTSPSATDPASILLGYPAPPPITFGRYFTLYYPDLLWLVAAAGAAALYIGGVLRLRARGDSWPMGRLAWWLAGCVALAFVTSGGPGVYGRVHFSAHMLQHMSLMVIVPFLLVLGAPVTLAMRGLQARRDGSFGPREMLLEMVHSRFLRIVGHPLVAATMFIASLVVFYYTPLFELAMLTHAGHVLMTAHFLLIGYVFIWSLIGIDPGPSRPPYPFRLILLLVMLGFHAFFGISLMSSGTLIAPDWWHALGQADDAALLADQQTGGSIAWAAGDIPSFMLGLALVVGWVRSDAQEARRLDRRADRDGDAELHEYNRQLAALHKRDGGR
jgi:cytochrome c oxidase assembly factor CtaG/putative copper export protein